MEFVRLTLVASERIGLALEHGLGRLKDSERGTRLEEAGILEVFDVGERGRHGDDRGLWFIASWERPEESLRRSDQGSAQGGRCAFALDKSRSRPC